MKQDSHFRSVIKGASWRIVGTLDTMMLSYIFTGLAIKALKIGGVELFTKIFLYWLHERLWMRLSFGRSIEIINGEEVIMEKHYRSIVKGISWRAIGSLDTFWIALLINHDSPTAALTAFYISGTEVITKVALFWLHERAWMRVKWGKKNVLAAS